MIVCLSYVAIAMPYMSAFYEVDQENGFITSILMFLVEVFFILDIVVGFISVYEKYDGSYEYSLKKISKNYLSGLFWIDIIPVIPAELLLKIFTIRNNTNKNFGEILKLIKLAKVFTIKSYITKLIKELNMNRNVLRIVMIMTLSILLIHIVGCFYFMASKMKDFGDSTWVWKSGTYYDDRNMQYYKSVYWAS